MSHNPFSTTFGMEPNNYIQRIEETQKIITDFSSDEPSNYVYLITGVRGSGKTVLLSNVASRLQASDDWIVVDPGPMDNLLENIASEIYENGKMKHLFLKTEFSFSFQGVSFSLKGESPVSSVMTLIKKMLDHIKKKKKRVLITIDEVDNSAQMKSFIQAYQSLIRLHYPVLLLMTGLYENVSRLQNDKSLTFLYRTPKIQLGALSLKTIAKNYQNYLQVDEKASLVLSKLTKGYAYAYQVLGYLMFEKKKKEVDDEILSEYDQYLAEYVYDKVFSELSDKEKEIVCTIHSDEKTEVTELREKCGIDTKAFGVYRNRLLKKGIINACSFGYIEFALPRFNEYLKYI